MKLNVENGLLSKERKILVADDEEWLRTLIKAMLKEHPYQIIEARDGIEALEKVEDEEPDLVLLDILMPRMDGLKVCETLRKSRKTRLLSIVIFTALEEEKLRALQMGANDFLSKPFSQAELETTVLAQLKLKSYIEQLEDVENILYFLADLVEARDYYTGRHTERVARFAVELGKKVGLSDETLSYIEKGGRLHDIGKVGIPDKILQKRGKLTLREYSEMQKHTLIGEHICKSLKSLKNVIPIIRSHHERWDGSGYPDGLKGEEIPLMARIVSIADAYDAMIHKRPYRDALTREEALHLLKIGKKKSWDPELVDLFVPIVSVSRGL